jgi:hypothetical protein
MEVSQRNHNSRLRVANRVNYGVKRAGQINTALLQ